MNPVKTPFRAARKFAATLLLAVAVSLLAPWQPLFAGPQLLPSTYGYGLDRAINPAGFGATSNVIEVTNLNDSGTGSLRAAVAASGSRVVVFRTSGVITLQTDLDILNPNITIAGQTAPSPGISIHGAPIRAQANNVLIQHVRVRPGDAWNGSSTVTRKAAWVSKANAAPTNIVWDHCTFMWSLDEIAGLWYSWDNVTFNKCIFAEPLHASTHIWDNSMPGNAPAQVETLSNTKSGFSTTTTTSNAVAVGGSYQLVNTDSDGDYIEYTLPVSVTTSLSEMHVVVVGIKGSDRAKYKVEVRTSGGSLLSNPGEIVDLYAPAVAQHTYVSQQSMTQSFTIPANTSSLKVRLIVSGRNASSTGWKLGVDQLSISHNHGMGPLISSGGTHAGTSYPDAAGKFTMIGCIIAHCHQRGPWVSAKQTYFANNISYNRHLEAMHLGHVKYPHVMRAAILGNTFIDGANTTAGSPPPIENSDHVVSGSQLYFGNAGDNVYNYGNRASPPPMVSTALNSFKVTFDPTVKTAGLAGVVPLTPANAYADTLLTAGARPADRDTHEDRIIDEIAQGAAINALASRPGSMKHSVAGAGGWPVYAVNTATWTLPANPNADGDGDGYTNLEEWLHTLAAQVEGTGGGGVLPVGQWSLDETSGTTATDSSGNGNHGTLTGGPAWTAGAINGGLSFDGADDKVNAGSAASLDDLTAVTVAAWIRPTSMGGGGKGRIVDKSSGTSPTNGWAFHVDGTNQLAFRVDYSTAQLNRVSATNAIATGTWQHVAVTWDGTTSSTGVRLYVNGVEVSYASGVNGSGTRDPDAASILHLGSESTGTRAFHGVLDDVRVYHGVLDAAGVLQLYQGGLPAPSGLSATPVAYNQINLSWTDNATNETGYKIERRKGTSGAYTQIATTGAFSGTGSFSDPTVGAGTLYDYRVRTYIGTTDSSYSNAANATTSEITSGRQGHWKLDGDATDSSGNGNNGVVGGGASYSTDSHGTGLNFDGVDDSVNAGSGATLDQLPAVTATAWINAASMGEGGKGRIIDKSASTAPANGWSFHVDGTNQISFRVDYSTTQLYRVSAANVISTGVWKHVLATWDGTSSSSGIHIYVDGVEVSYSSSQDGTGTRDPDGASNLFLGNESTNARTIQGVLDDVRVYNRVLGASEITAVYRAGM